METLTIILAIIILVAALAIRYYQVRLKHAINHWRFERGKHEEYRNAYYSKGDELEVEKELHETANIVKNHAINKAHEKTRHLMQLQEKNAGLKVKADNLRDLLEVAKAECEVKNMQKLQTEKQLQDLGAKYTQQAKELDKAINSKPVKLVAYRKVMSDLHKANETIKEVHKLLDSGAKGKETLAALLLTGEYLKKA